MDTAPHQETRPEEIFPNKADDRQKKPDETKPFGFRSKSFNLALAALATFPSSANFVETSDECPAIPGGQPIPYKVYEPMQLLSVSSDLLGSFKDTSTTNSPKNTLNNLLYAPIIGSPEIKINEPIQVELEYGQTVRDNMRVIFVDWLENHTLTASVSPEEARLVTGQHFNNVAIPISGILANCFNEWTTNHLESRNGVTGIGRQYGERTPDISIVTHYDSTKPFPSSKNIEQRLVAGPLVTYHIDYARPMDVIDLYIDLTFMKPELDSGPYASELMVQFRKDTARFILSFAMYADLHKKLEQGITFDTSPIRRNDGTLNYNPTQTEYVEYFANEVGTILASSESGPTAFSSLNPGKIGEELFHTSRTGNLPNQLPEELMKSILRNIKKVVFEDFIDKYEQQNPEILQEALLLYLNVFGSGITIEQLRNGNFVREFNILSQNTTWGPQWSRLRDYLKTHGLIPTMESFEEFQKSKSDYERGIDTTPPFKLAAYAMDLPEGEPQGMIRLIPHSINYTHGHPEMTQVHPEHSYIEYECYININEKLVRITDGFLTTKSPDGSVILAQVPEFVVVDLEGIPTLVDIKRADIILRALTSATNHVTGERVQYTVTGRPIYNKTDNSNYGNYTPEDTLGNGQEVTEKDLIESLSFNPSSK